MVKSSEKEIDGKLVYSLTKKQLKHAVQRNFDGLDNFDASAIFLSQVEESECFKKQDTNDKITEDEKVQYHFV